VNRRTLLVAGTTGAALAVFGGGAFFVFREKKAAIPPVPASSPIAQAAVLVRPHSPVIGPADAPVTIVEFFDPSCEACRAFHPIVKQIMAGFPGKVRLVIRYAAFHRGSDEAVRILETARLQDKFLPVLEALLDAQPTWAAHATPRLDLAWDVARNAGLDLERAQRERLMPHIAAALNFDAADVAAVGVTRTPTFFVNGKALADFGARQLLELVRAEVEKR
jgi:protein-disulfide isomerase